MPTERSSPSEGWRAVYAAMNVSPAAESSAVDCPDCGIHSVRVRRDTYWCPAHGRFAVGGV